MSDQTATGVIRYYPLALHKFTIEHSKHDCIYPEIEADVDQLWQQKLAVAQEKGLDLWDGNIYRLNNLEEVRRGSNTFNLGIIKYSYVLAASNYLKANPKTFPEDKYLNYIHTPVVIETADVKMILGAKVGNLLNRKVDLAGGFLQEDELEVVQAEDIEANAHKELAEEFGIRQQHISRTDFIGIARGKNSNVPMVFYCKLNISLAELEKVFDERTENEMDGIVAVAKKELKTTLLQLGGSKPEVWELVSHYWANQ